MQKPLLLVLLSLCGLSGAFGQVPTGNEDAEAKPLVKILIDQGQTFSKATKYDDAIKTFSEAVKKAQEIGDVIGEAESNDEMGRAYYLTGNYIKAKELYLNAVRLFHKASTESQEMKATGHVAQIEQSTGNSKEAREVFLKLIAYFKGRGDKKAAGTQLLNICFTEGSLRLFDDQLKHAAEAKEIESSLGDKSGEGTALNQTALAYRGMRRKEDAIKAFKEVVVFARAAKLASLEATADANLGTYARQDGDFQKAVNYYRQAQELYRSVNSTGLLADIGINLGIVYFQVGQPRLSADTLTQSAEIFRKFGNKPKLANALVNLGVVLDQAKLNARAEKVLTEALNLYQELGQESDMDSCYVTLGAILVREERFSEAARMVKKGLAIAEKFGEKLGVGTSNETLGNIAFYQKDFATALTCFTKSLNIYRALDNRSYQANTLGNVAKCQAKLGRLADSEATYRESIALLEVLRQELGASSEGKAGLLSQSIDTYHELISLLVQRGKVTEAFDLTQKTKARSLLDLIADGEVAVQREMSVSERNREAALRKKADDINGQMVQQGVQNEVGAKKRFGALKIELQKAEDELAAFKTQLYAKYPGLEDRRSARTATAAQIAARLPRNVALLEYVVADESLVFIVTSKGGKASVVCQRLPFSEAEITKPSAAFRAALADPHHAYKSLSQSLYKSLIAPVSERLVGVSQLIICPEGPLWDVSFAALSNGQFLAQRYELSYGYSATAIEATLRLAKSQRVSNSLLIMANPDFGGKTRFGDNPSVLGQRPIKPPSRPIEPPSRPIEPPSRPIEPPSRPIEPPSRDLSLGMRAGIVDLPGTQVEAEAIARLFPKAAILTRKRAQESTFVKIAGRFRYLHIASHAFFNDTSPMLSSIVLAKPNDASTDGYLTARELVDLKLNADLIVLSACNTARGGEQPGEGIIGLSWALFAAGVPAQVVSQWSVDDRATATLMTRFYKNLKSGESKALAIHNASLSLLKTQRGNDPKWKHPYYWAPFILIGDER